MKIAVFAGDGIGPEVTAQALRVLDELSLPGLTLFEGDVGAVAYRRHGQPLPDETLEMARAADAVLFGAVGDFSCDDLPRHLRPEQAILGLRSELGLFANLRPAAGFPGLEHLSSLKPEIARSIDVLVVRELNGDVYFGDKGERASAGGREGWDAMSYNEAEVRRIAHTAFRAAMGRGKRLTSVDKANVLETSRIWRETVIDVAKDYPEVTLDHMYVDNAAMQMVKAPGQFDTIAASSSRPWPSRICPKRRRCAPLSARPSMSRTRAAVTLPSVSRSAWAMAWSRIERPSRTDPSAALATMCKASASASTPSLAQMSAKWLSSSSTGMRRKSKRWVRLSTVTGSFSTSVVAKRNFTCAGGSSSVFSNALKALRDSM